MTSAAAALRKGPSGPRAVLTSDDIENVSTVPGVTVTDALDDLFTLLRHGNPVFVEDYLVAAGGDIRTAISMAWLATPTSSWYIYPPGTFTFVGAFLGLSDGFRNNTRHTGQNTELRRDIGGVAGGQNVFFYRGEVDATHADRIVMEGFKMSLLNCLTSFFGFAIGLESASDCEIRDCDFFCSLDAAATQGRIRWGINIFGGDQVAQPSAGTNNRVSRNKLTLSQIAGCSQGRSVDGIIIEDTEVVAANDFAISVVSSQGFSIQNVTIKNTICRDVQGSGVIFGGSDGQALNLSVLSNFLVDGVQLHGAQSIPILTSQPTSTVGIISGIVTNRVTITNVQTQLTNTANQARNVEVFGCDLASSFIGLTISNLLLGAMTTDDPLAGLFITASCTGVTVSNVVVEGQRGVRIIDCDKLSLSNVVCLDGQFSIEASTRNLVGGALSNCYARTTTNPAAGIQFASTTGRSFDKVQINNGVFIPTNAAALITSLTGGTMSMMLSNVDLVGNAPSVETAAGVIRATNVNGMSFPTSLVVAVPLVAAGAVGYVNKSMAGTRLSDLVLNEGVSANPQAQLVAAGVGGAYMNCRVQATGVVELAFLGPLAGGNFTFDFYRTN